MRVCMFAPELSVWSFGGVAEHAYQLSKQLVQLGCEVHVVCKSVKGRSVHEVTDGIEVHRIVPNTGPPWFFSVKKALFRRYCDQWKFDLFHSHGPCGSRIETPGPLVVTLHGTSAGEAREVFNDLWDLPKTGIWDPDAYVVHALAVPVTYLPAIFLRRIVKRATRIIAVSQFVKEESQRLLGAPAQKTEVIYNGATTQNQGFSKDKIQDSLVLFVGHLGVRKGLPYLIHSLPFVFDKNKNAKVAIVGDGPLKSPCQRVAMKLGISNRVTFTGAVTESQKNQWYQKARVCVFPSTYEPFPMVALEALTAGKPVVASSVGGLPEVIHNGVNGFLVPPRNPERIATALTRILSDEELGNRLAANALRTIDREFRWEKIAQKTLKLYRSCVGEID